MSRARAVGIDLGTTYSAVAWIAESGKSAMISNSDGDLLTPSLVLFEDAEVIVGKEAGKVGILKPARFASCVKRDMGSPVYSQPICGEYLPPEVIQAWILKKLKADIVREVGPDFRVVITVPAFFDEPRRKATADAGTMAALPLLDVVNEPTAAALAFGEELGYLSAGGEVREPLKVLVYDLGGGTFDVTLLDMRPGDLRTLATDGDVRLGGRDWDLRLADFAAEAFIHEHREDPRANPASKQRLLREVEEAKRTLSARQKATIRIDHAGSSTTVKVTREQFEELTADLVERTAYTTRQLLATAGLAWTDINRVLLVGGATRMPMIGRMLEKLSGIVPDQKVHPDEAVARGAAVYAGYLLATAPGSQQPPSFHVTNVNSHSLGIEGLDPQTERKRNVIIIPRNTPLPARAKERFMTKEADQRSVAVRVLEGESSIPSECTRIGRTVLGDLPSGLPAAWPVEITYEYEVNGRLRVWAVVPGTNREVRLQLVREGSLSDERLGRWKQLVSGEGGRDAFSELVDEALDLHHSDDPSADALHLAVPSAVFQPLDAPTGVAQLTPASPVPLAPMPVSPAPVSQAPVSQAPVSMPGPAASGPQQWSMPVHRAAPAGIAGQPVGSPLATGQPMTGQPMTGQPMTGQPMTGQPMTGQPMTGQPMTGQQAAAPSYQPQSYAPPQAAPSYQPQSYAPPQAAPPQAAPAAGFYVPGAAAVPPPPAPATPTAPTRPPAPGRAVIRKSGLAAPVTAIGVILSSLFGLVLGYYLLVFLRPEANFLGLSPSWFPWEVKAPESPPAPIKR